MPIMTSTVRPEMKAQVAQIGAVLVRRLDEPTQLTVSSYPVNVYLCSMTSRLAPSDPCGANMRLHLAAPTLRRGDAD
jgi:hypothetical protein